MSRYLENYGNGGVCVTKAGKVIAMSMLPIMLSPRFWMGRTLLFSFNRGEWGSFLSAALFLGKIILGITMLDKIDRTLLNMLQQDCTLSLQTLADAVNLTSTPCWKRLKRMEEEGIIRARVALLDNERLGLGLTAFVLLKTQQHNRDWYQTFTRVVSDMPEVLAFYRMAGEYDYLMQVQVADMKSYDDFYKRLVNGIPGLVDVTSSFAMERIKHTTALPLSL